MKVIVYSTLYPNSNQPQHGIFVEKRVLELQRRTGWEFKVVAPVPWFPFASDAWGKWGIFAKIPEYECRHGIEIFHPRYLVLPWISWQIAPAFQLPAAITALRNIKSSGFDFDLIDAHFLFPDCVAAVAAGKVLKVPAIVTARGSDVNVSIRYSIPRTQTRYAVKNAAAVVTVAEDLRRVLLDRVEINKGISVVRNGVDGAIFNTQTNRDEARASLGLCGPTILSVGNLRKLKGHHLLLEALVSIPKATLLVVGQGEERSKLEVLARDLGVADRVNFMGEISNSDLPALYAAADVFALASSSEGCPNVILEAMACGTPIVATAVGAIPDLVPKEGQKYLIRNREPSEIAKRICQVLIDNPHRETYSNHAKRFSWDASCDLLKAIFETHAA